MKIKNETAWACVAYGGSGNYGKPWLHEGTVRTHRSESQARIGTVWAKKGETPSQGWKRAYRKGWRCLRVTVGIKQ